MRAYIIRRILLIIPTVFMASIIIFLVMRFIPGDIIDMMTEQMEVAAQMDRAAIAKALGLDQPLIIQYGRWIGNIILHGDLGNSMWTHTPVVDSILASWPVTFELGILSIIVAQLIALPVGIYSALRQDTWGDYIARSFAIMCIAIPGFWLGTMVIVFPSLWWGYSPSIILIPFTEDPIGNLK
ncbi:ABC transporter permease, partial [Chloroflexota bacterium]